MKANKLSPLNSKESLHVYCVKSRILIWDFQNKLQSLFYTVWNNPIYSVLIRMYLRVYFCLYMTKEVMSSIEVKTLLLQSQKWSVYLMQNYHYELLKLYMLRNISLFLLPHSLAQKLWRLCHGVLYYILHVYTEGVFILSIKLQYKLNSVALVHERTIPTKRQPLVGEVSANFCG
jgi:hypothetical protein